MKTNMKEFLQHTSEGVITDMKNPNCINCIECCSIFSMITPKEYKTLRKYINNEGKEIFAQGLNNWLESSYKHNSINLMCPFISKNKRCLIYNKRPRVCREFHCSESLNKLNKEEIMSQEHYSMLNLLPKSISLPLAKKLFKFLEK